MKNLLFFIILGLCLINLSRIAIYLLSGDAYMRAFYKAKKRRERWHLPTLSVLVPAHNEEKVIERNLLSLYQSHYPASKLEVIIINDGSTDHTKDIIKQFKKSHNDRCKIRLINRPNKGKAAALNYALRRLAKGQIVMCLDADSTVDKNALRNAVQYFRDRHTVALSTNVNIVEDGSLLALIQRFEYILCSQMKKSQAFMGVEYIVGGLGSIFRRSMLQKVAFYDTNTMTEDIDLTMKIILSKTKRQKIAYAADSIVYTEAAHTIKELRSQRYRWKYGRTQTFYKQRQIFFSNQSNHAKRLAWLMLPFTIWQDLVFLLEPFILGYFIYISYLYGSTKVFLTGIMVLSYFLLFSVWSANHLSLTARLRLSYYAPPMYIYMYILSYVEYFASIKTLLSLPKLKASIGRRHTTWHSPARLGSVIK